MTFGERLRELRRSKELTLRTLAEMVHLDFTYLSKIENAKVDYTPSPGKIRALARALDADEIEMLKLADKVPPELEPLTRSPGARAFFRRAHELKSSEDWEDLLAFLDRRQKEKRKPGKDAGET